MSDLGASLSDLSKKTGKTQKELNESLSKLKEKYAGLLTDSGALLLLARELGAELTEEGEDLSLADLKAGLKNINVTASIERIFNEKEVDSSKGTLLLRNIILIDEGKQARLSLFGKQCAIPEKLQLEKGDKVKIFNAVTQEFNNEIQLRLGYNGKINLEKKSPVVSSIKKLRQDEQANVSGIITKKFNEKTFEKEGNTSKLLAFELTDGSQSIKCNAWNEASSFIKPLSVGSIIKIENAFARKGLNEVLEININSTSRIIPEYQNDSLVDFKKTFFKEKTFADLVPSSSPERSIIKGIIVLMNDSSFVYDACSVCNKKVTDGYCHSCEKDVSSVPKMFLSLLVDDGSTTFNTTSFNSYPMLEKTENDLDKLKEALVGKKFEFIGIPRFNSMTNEKEFLADSLKQIE